jgi:diaminopimelate epimerase
MLKRGTLGIEITDDGNVFMEGPSVRVFDGEIE